MSILITVASKHGSTAEVGDRLAQRLREAGFDVATTPPDDVASLDGFDAVVVGSAVYAGSWMRSAARFVDRFTSELRELPVWAFSCGPVGEPAKPTERPKAADAVVAKVGAELTLFGGVISRADLALVERSIIGMLKVPDGDYREWDGIDAWIESIAEALRAGAPARN